MKMKMKMNTTDTMDDHTIEHKDNIRDLGILVYSKFTLTAHIEITTKARQSSLGRISNSQFCNKN